MKKITFSILLVFLVFTTSNAQDYTTPNTGVTWTLDDIAAASPTTVTGSGTAYSLLGNLTVSENDTFIIDSNLTLSIDAGLRITIFGAFTVDSDEVTITAIDEAAPYDGFRFEENSDINIQNATITYGGGLRVLTEDFIIVGSTLSYNVSGTTSSAVIQLSRGKPEISWNTISFNKNPAIGSAANAQVSPLINENHIEGNNQENSNRPQINLGVSIPSVMTEIINNTIIGDRTKDMVGGIALANFVGGTVYANIAENIIQNNRYGLTIIGDNSDVTIFYNTIEDNNTQGDPDLGGSGININAPSNNMDVYIIGNEIRRNLWGITLQGEALVQMGDEEPYGGFNIFSENENGGVTYALYNNTPNTIMAKNNCWIEDEESTAANVEDVIFHSVDDSSLGEVIFEPFLCGVTIGVEDNTLVDFGFYPNPASQEINFNNTHSFETVAIYGVQGNLIQTKNISEGHNVMDINLPTGLYLVKFSNKDASITKKMMVK